MGKKDYNIQVISAGAGSGKTFRLTGELAEILKGEGDVTVRPSGIIGTTFTKKAAAELKERVRSSLIESGLSKEANELLVANIGTVNSVCSQILKNFCYEAGLPPKIQVLDEEKQKVVFYEAIGQVISPEVDKRMLSLERKFGYSSPKDNDSNWKKGLSGIISLARSNRIKATDLGTHADKSITELKKYLPAKISKSAEELDKEMLNALTRGLSLVDPSDKTGTTSKYVTKANSLIRSLKKGSYKYTEFSTVINAKCAKASLGASEAIKDELLKIQGHPQFQDDLFEYIRTQFDVAAKAMDFYQDYKARRGLIDFVDQEERLFELLELESVTNRLKEDLDLLLVDEFQDTSPLQLAIFLKLSKVVKKTIWVGDPKQSIYAFRGADPILMTSMIDFLGGVKEEDIQKTSYRSTPELVDIANSLFTRVFDFPKEQIELSANRKTKKGMGQALELWQARRMTKDECKANEVDKAIYGAENSLISLSQEIHEYLKTNPEVKGGDVAVLMRQNSQCDLMASYLRDLGHKVAIEGRGLDSTPEVIYLQNVLTNIANPYDELSKSVITFLENEKNLEEIVNSRLDWLDDAESKGRWLDESEALKELNYLRENLGEPSVVEIIDKVLLEYGLRQRVRSWGEESAREENLEMVRSLAMHYEDSCLTVGSGATLSGFLLWFNSMESKDLPISPGRGEDAINIMTYHKSKGLEWSVVFMADMHSNAWVSHWSPMIVDESEQFDPEEPLKNRWIRSWVNPTFKSKLPFVKDMELTAMNDALMEEAIRENSRLLYVGVTRARDKLVMIGESFKWIEQILDSRGSSLLCPDSQGLHKIDCFGSGDVFYKDIPMMPANCFEWSGSFIDQEYSVLKPSRLEKTDRDPLFVSPSSVEGDTGAFSGELVDYGDILNIGLGTDVDVLGTALHNIFAMGENLSLQAVEETLKNHHVNISNNERIKSVLERVQGCESKLQELFSDFKWHRECPVRMVQNGQIINGIVDLVLEGSDELILIDHKSYQHEAKEVTVKAGEFRPQLDKYSEILEKSFNKPVKRKFINFFLLGKMIEMGEA